MQDRSPQTELTKEGAAAAPAPAMEQAQSAAVPAPAGTSGEAAVGALPDTGDPAGLQPATDETPATQGAGPEAAPDTTGPASVEPQPEGALPEPQPAPAPGNTASQVADSQPGGLTVQLPAAEPAPPEPAAPLPEEASFIPLAPSPAGAIEGTAGAPAEAPAPELPSAPQDQPSTGPGQPALALQEDPELRAVVEAIVYVTEEPVTPRQIAEVVKRPEAEVKAALDALVQACAAPERGISVREIAGGYKMATKAEHHEILRAFARSLKPPLKLSLAALETLATIAYKQPITAPEIMEIRGVQGAGVLKTLLDRKLIQTAGRKNVIGKPILYRTTKEFLVQFGLKDLSELPTLKEFEELRRLATSEPGEEAEGAPETSAPAQPETSPGGEPAAEADSVPETGANSRPEAEAAGGADANAAGSPETPEAEPAAEVASAPGTDPEDSGERGGDEQARS